MQTRFFAPDRLRDKDHQWNITIDYTFKYRPDYVDVEYEYQLTDEEVEEVLKAFFRESNIADFDNVESLLNMMCTLFDCDYDEINSHLDDFLEYKPLGIKIKTWIKNTCEKKAFEEFKQAFDYWVDEDEVVDYIDTDEV